MPHMIKVLDVFFAFQIIVSRIDIHRTANIINETNPNQGRYIDEFCESTCFEKPVIPHISNKSEI